MSSLQIYALDYIQPDAFLLITIRMCLYEVENVSNYFNCPKK